MSTGLSEPTKHTFSITHGSSIHPHFNVMFYVPWYPAAAQQRTFVSIRHAGGRLFIHIFSRITSVIHLSTVFRMRMDNVPSEESEKCNVRYSSCAKARIPRRKAVAGSL